MIKVLLLALLLMGVIACLASGAFLFVVSRDEDNLPEARAILSGISALLMACAVFLFIGVLSF